MTSVILICLIFVGFGLIIFSVFRKESTYKINVEEAKAVQEDLNVAIEDADGAINELNGLCSNAFDEFEEKYQELLFLYQMIEEKKNNSSLNIKVDNENTKAEKKSAKEKTVSSKKNENKTRKSNYANPKLSDILKLQKQGLSIAEIAKELNMGQGEVKLIAELGKER